jgi:hypothetical protein
LAASIAVLAIALAAAAALLVIHRNQKYSEPEYTLKQAIRAASEADLPTMRLATSQGYYEDLIGHFGEQRYDQVRAAMQTAYDLAEPRWVEYWQRAKSAADGEYSKLHNQVELLGRAAFIRLPLEQRMRLMEEPAHRADFIFQEGVKALPVGDRKKIEDVDAFRAKRDWPSFFHRESWNLLSEEDRNVLGSAAVLSSAVTPEKLAFLEKIGVPLLNAEQKRVLEGVSASELSLPRQFMLKQGEPLTKQFFAQAAIARDMRIRQCEFLEEDQHGSLLRGTTAICRGDVVVRGQSVAIAALLNKQGFDWQIQFTEPNFFEIREAYPPKEEARAPRERATPTARAPEQYVAPEPPPQRVVLPRARWQTHPAPELPAVMGALLGYVRQLLVSPFLWAFFVVMFMVVMTVNYWRLRRERFTPELLEGEQQLDEIAIPMWWMRTFTRLTNRRILQDRLNWFFSKRKVYAIALDDVHSVTWRRYTNWLVILLGVYFVGRLNPLALLLVMLGVEAKIHSVRFNTPFAHMLWTNVAITCFSRKHFNELTRFFKKAQLHWAQVRTQKQLPVPSTATYKPETDRDFCWGTSVWLFVGVWVVLAIAQRVIGPHATLDDYVIGPLLLSIPAAVSLRSLRDGVLVALLGVVAMATVKFPGTGLLPSLFGADGNFPNFEQYAGILVTFLVAALLAAALARGVPEVAFFAPVVWIGFVGQSKPEQALDTALYAKCALAIAGAVLFSWLDAVVAMRKTVPSSETAKAVARGATV